ncbi:MAG: class I SAM-dependent methyltransferase [Pirellulales bacterium]
MNIPSWKLPPGVCRGTWDYLQSESIAQDYDQKLAKTPLLKLDQRFIQRYLPCIVDTSKPPLIADFGCGTGRISRMLSPMGYRMLNVDLSPSMLNELKKNCQHPELNECVQANLVELDFLKPNSLEMALCLFSSIGMILGRSNRVMFLRSVHHALVENAKFILHVHNRYHSLWHPTGPTWLLKTWLKSRFSQSWEYGDRVFVDLGIPRMFLHIYSRRELIQDLKQAGFSAIEILPINVAGDSLLMDRRLATFRAGGFFAVAKK